MKNRLLLLLLLLPLFWIGTENLHDWGDDFAQYILQARNIVTGQSQINDNLVFPKEELPFAIVAYPVGFPLLLAPVFAKFGLFIPPYLYLISFFLIISSILLFEYLKRIFDVQNSFLIAIMFSYNLISLILKKEILSEFPFVLALLALFLIIQTGQRKTFVLAGLLAGILVSIRVSGFVIFPAILSWQLVTKNGLPMNKRLANSCLFIATGLAVFGFLNMAIFNIDLKNFFGFYAQQFDTNSEKIIANFLDLFGKAAELILPPLKSIIWTWLVLVLVGIGFTKRFKHAQLADWFFLFYLLLIVFYPYSSSGMRFLFPVIPIILIYFVIGFETIAALILSKQRSSQFLIVIACLSIIFSLKTFYSLPKADGPYSKDARSAFNFIRTKTPENAVILFSRARALNLYADRKATFLIQHKSENENFATLQKIKCDYILYADERSGAFNQNLQDFLMKRKSDYDTLFKEDRYLILQLNTSKQP